MNIVKFIILAFLFGAMLNVPNIAWADEGKTLYKVGVMHTFNNADPACYEQYINNMPNAIQMAWEDFKNANSSIGFDVKFINYDYEGNKMLAAKRMREAAADEVIAVIGYVCSDYAFMAGEIAQKLGVPMITPTATADKLVEIGDYVKLACFSDSYQGEAIARFMYETVKKKKVVVVTALDCSYCRSLSAAFQKSFNEYGGRIVFDHSLLRKDVAFDDLIEKLKSTEYDAVFIPNYALQSAAIIAQITMSGIKTVYVGGDAWNWEEAISKIVGDGKFLGYMTKSWTLDMPFEKSRKFLAMYEKRYNEQARDVAAHSYDAAMLLFEALSRRKKVTRSALKDALMQIDVHDGVVGRMVFSGERSPKSAVIIMELTGAGQKRYSTVYPK